MKTETKAKRTKTRRASATKTASATKSASASKAQGKKIKADSSAAEGLRELLIDGLKDIYWAEKKLTKALPKMVKNATTPKLKNALEEHLSVTEKQVKKVEKVFDMLGKKAKSKKCEAMEGLIKEGKEIIKGTQPGPVRDAGIIGASQKIEHYEIATYGTLAAYAKTLGEDKAHDLLGEILEEEKKADSTLTKAAYNNINFEALDKNKK